MEGGEGGRRREGERERYIERWREGEGERARHIARLHSLFVSMLLLHVLI